MSKVSADDVNVSDAVRMLLVAGAVPTAADKYDETPLVWALQNGQTDVVNLLSPFYNDSAQASITSFAKFIGR